MFPNKRQNVSKSKNEYKQDGCGKKQTNDTNSNTIILNMKDRIRAFTVTKSSVRNSKVEKRN